MSVLGRIFLGLVLMAAALPARALELTGRFEQGGLAFGQVAPGTKVLRDGADIPVSPDGLFVLGFDRDAPDTVRLRAVSPDGAATERRLEIAPRQWEIQRIDGLAQEKVTPPPETLERIREEAAVIRMVRQKIRPEVLFRDGFSPPLEGTVTGVFGSQRILNGEPRLPHSGVDIAAPVGTPVRAVADGVVSLAHPGMYFAGKTLMLDHGLGVQTVYIHLSEIGVAEGEVVRRGQTIGKVGQSGRATGPHLHWGISVGETRVDPEILVSLPLRSLP